MKHMALYRKWRPQRFAEVVGQEHVSRTLLNAIRRDRLAHAYLFCGPRGTGKTTSARLLAKALNCDDPRDAEPCNQCQNCDEITAGHSLDVIEIDAASNRGIDSARDLREQVRFATSSGRYRVFIIDEFHMLTKEAFNALLKTLEEPPENVIFVLATTEPHEVLQTIVSRCQRFDFQRIGVRQLSGHLKHVASAEQIGVSEGALDAIARKANGGLRDGLSLLDQVQALALPGEELDDVLVYQTLGLVQEDELFELLRAGFAGELEPLLQTSRQLLEQGHDALQIVQDLIQLLRHLSLAHLSAERLEELAVPGHLVPQIQLLGQQLSRGQIVQAIEGFIQTSDRLHHCAQPDIWLEADLISFCLQAESPLLQRLERLEKQVKSGRVSAPDASPQAGPAAPTPPVQPQSASDARPAVSTSSPQQAPSSPQLETAPELPPRPAASAAPEQKQEISPPPALPSSPVGPEEPESAVDVEPVDSSEHLVLWKQFLARVAKEHPPMYGFISSGQLSHVDTDNRVWMVEFIHNNKALLRRLQQKMQDGKLQALVSDMMGAPFTLETRLQQEKKKLNEEASSRGTPVQVAAPRPQAPDAPAVKQAAPQPPRTEPKIEAQTDFHRPASPPVESSPTAPPKERPPADQESFSDAPPSAFDDGYIPLEPHDLPDDDFEIDARADLSSIPHEASEQTIKPSRSAGRPPQGNGNGQRKAEPGRSVASQANPQQKQAQKKAKRESAGGALKQSLETPEQPEAETQGAQGVGESSERHGARKKGGEDAGPQHAHKNHPQLLQDVAELFKGRIVQIRES